MNGLYLCYNEKKNGSFNEAIEMSNNEYLLWRHKIRIRKKIKYPAKVVIKIKGEERYYKGDLLLIQDTEDFKPHVFTEDAVHRPKRWRNLDPCRSAFFIANLCSVPKPRSIEGIHPPQGIVYIDTAVD